MVVSFVGLGTFSDKCWKEVFGEVVVKVINMKSWLLKETWRGNIMRDNNARNISKSKLTRKHSGKNALYHLDGDWTVIMEKSLERMFLPRRRCTFKALLGLYNCLWLQITMEEEILLFRQIADAGHCHNYTTSGWPPTWQEASQSQSQCDYMTTP